MTEKPRHEGESSLEAERKDDIEDTDEMVSQEADSAVEEKKFVDTFKKFDRLPDEEEQEAAHRLGEDYPLFKQLRYGTQEERLEAQKQLMVKHRNLVPKFINILQNQKRIYTTTALSKDDYIQAGYVGLSKALRRFDYAKGLRFSTHAFWWVMQGVTRELQDHGLLVRVPVHQWLAGAHVSRKKAELTDDSGYEPTHEEIAGAMKKPTTPSAVELATRARQVINRDKHRVSIDNRTLVSGDMSPDEQQFVAQRGINDPSDFRTAALIGAFEQQTPYVRDALCQFIEKNFTERDATILIDRIGLKDPDGKGMTLEDIGKKIL